MVLVVVAVVCDGDVVTPGMGHGGGTGQGWLQWYRAGVALVVMGRVGLVPPNRGRSSVEEGGMVMNRGRDGGGRVDGGSEGKGDDNVRGKGESTESGMKVLRRWAGEAYMRCHPLTAITQMDLSSG